MVVETFTGPLAETKFLHRVARDTRDTFSNPPVDNELHHGSNMSEIARRERPVELKIRKERRRSVHSDVSRVGSTSWLASRWNCLVVCRTPLLWQCYINLRPSAVGVFSSFINLTSGTQKKEKLPSRIFRRTVIRI